MVLAIVLYEQFINRTHIHLCPKYAVFEYSAACLSVVFEPRPGLILFAPMWGEFETKVFT